MSKPRTYPSRDRLRELFDYRPDGFLVWRQRSAEDFASPRAADTWNARYAGRVAGCLSTPTKTKINGYWLVRIDDVLYAAHRLIWIFHHGDIPPGLEVDHERHDRSDNRIERLELVTHARNNRNQRRHRTNTSGVTGVWWNAATNSWRAEGRINNVRHHLGMFKNIADAATAIGTFRADNDYSPLHGMAA